MTEKPPVPLAIAAVTSSTSPPATPTTDETQAAPGALLDQHKRYAQRFHDWMLGLNRHDFMQAKRLLDQMMYAYTKHVVKQKSPPMRKEEDVPGKTSDGAQSTDLRDGHPDA